MKANTLLQVIGAASCLALANCRSTWPYENSSEASARSGSGYSLDNPATGSRYMAGTTTPTAPDAPSTPVDPGAPAAPLPPTEGVTSTTTTTTTPPVPPAPTVTTTPPPSTTTTVTTTTTPPATTSAPTYGSPVPGRRGFVYPPGVEAKPENMVDVRDFTPGQKVRDPRTGKIFLVP